MSETTKWTRDLTGVDIAAHASRHQDGGADEISLTGLSGEPADVVAKSLFDAYSIIAADTDDIPAAITMAASTIPARLAAGGIVAATPAQILAICSGQAAATFDWNSQALGNVGHIGIKLGVNNNVAIDYDESYTDPATDCFGGRFIIRGGATTGNTAHQIGGLIGDARILAANNKNWTSALYGVLGTFNILTGATGVFTQVAGLWSEGTISGGTITNWTGLQVTAPGGAGAVTNAYGIKVGAITKGGTLNYAIYTEDGIVRLGGLLSLANNILFTSQALSIVIANPTTLAICNDAAGTSYRNLNLATLSASNINFNATAQSLSAPNNDDGDYLMLKARDSDSDTLVEIARLAGAADPYFQATLPLRLFPIATASLPATPVEGMIAYDDTLNKFIVYTGAAWIPWVVAADISTAVSNHEAAADPHTGYVLETLTVVDTIKALVIAGL